MKSLAGLAALFFIAMVAFALAAGPSLLRDIQVRFRPNGMTIHTESETYPLTVAVNERDRIGWLRSQARGASFALLLPSGLPKGSKANWVMAFGKEVFGIAYKIPNRRSAFFLLTDAGKAVPTTGLPTGRRSRQVFVAGGERVTFISSGLTKVEIAQIERATQAASQH